MLLSNARRLVWSRSCPTLGESGGMQWEVSRNTSQVRAALPLSYLDVLLVSIVAVDRRCLSDSSRLLEGYFIEFVRIPKCLLHIDLIVVPIPKRYPHYYTDEVFCPGGVCAH